MRFSWRHAVMGVVLGWVLSDLVLYPMHYGFAREWVQPAYFMPVPTMPDAPVFWSVEE